MLGSASKIKTACTPGVHIGGRGCPTLSHLSAADGTAKGRTDSRCTLTRWVFELAGYQRRLFVVPAVDCRKEPPKSRG